MGIKPPDSVTIPQCHDCHSATHAKGDLTFWGDMSKPIELALFLYHNTSDKETCIHRIIGFNRDFRNR